MAFIPSLPKAELHFGIQGAREPAMLLDMGLLTTVNSNGPACFGGYVNDNLAQVAPALELSETEFATLAANGFEAASLAPETPQG